jgi:hypothetical protein
MATTRTNALSFTNAQKACHAPAGLAASRLDYRRKVNGNSSTEIHKTKRKKLTGFRHKQMAYRPSDDPLAMMSSSMEEIVWTTIEHSTNVCVSEQLTAIVCIMLSALS